MKKKLANFLSVTLVSLNSHGIIIEHSLTIGGYMDANGKVHLGSDYRSKVQLLEELTGKRDADVVRTIIDNVLYDAERLAMKQVPVQEIGIKATK